MDLVIADRDDRDELVAELRRVHPGARLDTVGEDLVVIKGVSAGHGPLEPIVFARQWLPGARFTVASSISGWVRVLLESGLTELPDDRPWRLHCFPRYGGTESAGRERCRLIEDGVMEVLKRTRRGLLRRRVVESGVPIGADDTVVQLVLTAPDRGFLSVACAPEPYRLRRVLAPFPAGEIPVAVDKEAPSRAFSKLVEAEARLGRTVREGEDCIDLGASPGSWTYVAVRRGARVVAVDRSPLRDDLMAHPRVTYLRGDAFRHRPPAPVDWLLCDVIAAPDRTLGLLEQWLEQGWCRRFVVTIKFKGRAEYEKLEAAKGLLSSRCREYVLVRLCANRNEACAAGERLGC